MKKIIIIILLLLASVCYSRSAFLKSDINNDGIVNNLDVAVISGEWLKKSPDWAVKIKKYQCRADLTMREKQMLYMAEKTRPAKERKE